MAGGSDLEARCVHGARDAKGGEAGADAAHEEGRFLRADEAEAEGEGVAGGGEFDAGGEADKTAGGGGGSFRDTRPDEGDDPGVGVAGERLLGIGGFELGRDVGAAGLVGRRNRGHEGGFGGDGFDVVVGVDEAGGFDGVPHGGGIGGGEGRVGNAEGAETALVHRGGEVVDDAGGNAAAGEELAVGAGGGGAGGGEGAVVVGEDVERRNAAHDGGGFVAGSTV